MSTDSSNVLAPLVEVTRGDVIERVHYGHAVVIDKNKNIVLSLGDPHKFTYMRSCAKPVQAIPVVQSGTIDHFGFNEKELAIMCASHYAEPVHLDTLEHILYKVGLKEEHLLCGNAISLKPARALELAGQGKQARQLFNDCSGKHVGILAYCLFKGYSIEEYTAPNHPAQQDIIGTFAEFCEYPRHNISVGIDGCSVPVFALPLYNMALAYLKLSNSEPFDTPYRETINRVFAAMTAHPEMISGSQGFCTELMANAGGKLIGKVGAEGV